MAHVGRLLTAMLTPFHEDGEVNHEAAQHLARLVVGDGSDGLVLAGTTGEAPTLSDAEKLQLIRAVKEAVPTAQVVAGTGTNDTRHSIHLSEQAMAAGADALLAVVPYYNKPTQEGMFQHFRAIAEVGPVIMYNIQGRTAVNMTADTTLRCGSLAGVIGVKEASGNIEQMTMVCAGASDSFRVWSGDDGFTLPLLAVGGYGVISVSGHLAGRAFQRMIQAHLEGRPAEAAALAQRLQPLINALMSIAANPIPLKTAMNQLGFPAGPFRLPLTPLDAAAAERLSEAVARAGDLISFRAGIAATSGLSS